MTDDDAQLGAETRASVGVATILGQKYLELAPTGELVPAVAARV